MISSKFFKFWLVYFGSIAYLFCYSFFNVIPWETPSHIYVILTAVASLGCALMVCIILCLWDDNEGLTRNNSFDTFGKTKLWRIWQWVAIPMIVWGIFKWDHFFLIFASTLLYLGMKLIISNHNKHVDRYNEEEVIKRARQESAEKVTL